MDKPMVRTALGVGRFVIALLLCVSLAASLLLTSLQPLLERQLYEATAARPEFVAALQADVQDYLDGECLFYGLPLEAVSDVLTADQIKAAAAARMASVYEALCSGEKPAAVTVDAAPFEAAIAAYFDTLPVEEKPLDTTAAATIAADFATGLAAVMQLGITEKITDMAHPVFAEQSLPRRVLKLVPWCILLAVLCAAIGLIPVRSTLRARAYGVAGAAFVGSALAAVPTWLFVGLDFPASIALGDSALREYVRLCLYTVLDRMTWITTTAFVVSAVLLTASVVWVVRKQKA